ncbi:MAG: hypothetical protein IJ630_07010 [Treponema sp.]|nr:hypothetical protein [Treponema sp.]
MKKIFFLFLFLSAFSLFAESTRVHTIHFSFPLEARTLNKTNFPARKYLDLDSNFKASYLGGCLNWNKLIFRENGLALLFGVGTGADFAKIPDLSSDFFEGFLISGKFGLGFAPVKNKKIILAFHGFVGLNLRILDLETKYKVANISDEMNYRLEEFNFTSGFDGIFLVKLTERLGLFSALDISTVFAGHGSVEVSRSNDLSSDYGSKELKYKNILNGINIVPRIGLCWGY